MPRGSSGRVKSRQANSDPYTKTRPVDPISRSNASSSLASQSRKAEGMNDGMKKMRNIQSDKWDIASKIQSQVIERDVELRCSDGTVMADQAVLAAVSNFLKEIFNAESVILTGTTRKADLVTLLLPDIDCGTIYNMLACFYWGFIPLSSATPEKITQKVQRIKVAWNILHIDVVISQLEPDDSKLNIPGKHQTRLAKTTRKKEIIDVKIEEEEIGLNQELDEDDPDDPTPLPDLEVTRTNLVTPRVEVTRTNLVTPRAEVTRTNLVTPRAEVTSTNTVNQNYKAKAENKYTYSMMAIHECVNCKGLNEDGKPDREVMNLSFKDKHTTRRIRDHYGKCLYNAGKVHPYVDPEEENSDSNGKVIDEYGRRYKYQCKVKACWKQGKECGYKELAMHNAIEHGILEKILEKETDPKYVTLLAQLRAAEQREFDKVKPLKCKIKDCEDGEVPFENEHGYLKLQTHYAVEHYRAWFVNKDDGGKVRNQKVVEPGRGTVCRNCKDRVYGYEEQMMGHYAAKHARLADAVQEGQIGISDDDARKILLDLYPDRVAEFDRSRK